MRLTVVRSMTGIKICKVEAVFQKKLLTLCQNELIIQLLTRCQNISKREHTDTKKNIGSQLALYPTPVTVIGAMDGEKPTWTLVAHVGIIGHDCILISLAAPHFINHCIKENQKLSVNIVNEDFLPEAD